jgi:hypothetical protein
MQCSSGSKWTASDRYQPQYQIQLENLLHWIHKLEQKTLAYHILQTTRHIFWNVIAFRLISPPAMSVPVHCRPIHFTLGATRCSTDQSIWNVSTGALSSHSLYTWCHKMLFSCTTQLILFTFTSTAFNCQFTRLEALTAMLLQIKVTRCYTVYHFSYLLKCAQSVFTLQLLYVTSCYYAAACLGNWSSGLQ